MMRHAAVLVAVVSLAACEIDASIGRDELDSQGGGGGDALGEGGGSDSGDGADQGGSGGGGDEGGSGGGGGTTSRPDEDGESGADTTDHPPVCQVHDTDSECAVCRKSHCCEQIVFCHDQTGCFCFWDCLVTTDDTVEVCRTHCGYDGHAFDDVLNCQIDQCSAVCSDHPEDLPPMG